MRINSRKTNTTPHKDKPSRHGFTLIELSIVLVIIGLITGGVLVGQDLINGAKIRSIISQTEKYDTAFSAFKLTYNCLPGDCAHATTFFADANNGNGNRNIEWPHSGTTGDYGSAHIVSNESYQIWKMLGDAKLIEGNYTGSQHSPYLTDYDGTTYKSGINAPTTSFDNGIAIYNNGYFIVGRHSGISDFTIGDNIIGAFLTETDMAVLDQKIDDGIPNQGQVLGLGAPTSSSTCIYYSNLSTGCANFTSAYNTGDGRLYYMMKKAVY